MDLLIKYTSGMDQDFINLCHQLDEYLNDIVGGEQNRKAYIPYNTLSDIHNVFVAYSNKLPVGCAAIKRISSDTAEVKRVFVRSNYRGNKIAERLMLELETKARQLGYCRLLLETGEPLVAATGLYHKLGYGTIDNYGPYVDMPESICMEKELPAIEF